MKDKMACLLPEEKEGTGYKWKALEKALSEPEKVIDQLKEAGLLGRGGALFPTGSKWELVKNSAGHEKYVICNADEGEPGTGNNRLLIGWSPYSLLEGIIICGVAVGAESGFIYLRREYKFLIPTLDRVIKKAKKDGALGMNLLGSGKSFSIHIISGLGAYICGEETALLESMEGRRGEPRLKPPYPGTAGYFGMPTVINNAETFLNIPRILLGGTELFREQGTEKTHGRKLFTITGCVKRPGVYEAEIGSKIGELLEMAGGCREKSKIKGIQTGGESGIVASSGILEVPFSPEGCREANLSFGAGDLMFFDQKTDICDLCRSIVSFFANESCGCCTPCRLGLKRVLVLLDGLISFHGSQEELEEIRKMADYIYKNSRCALGAAAVTPLMSAMKNFSQDFSILADKGDNTWNR